MPEFITGRLPAFDFAAISRAFAMDGYRSALPHGNGHIHDTFLLTCDGGGRRYLVQRINERVFRDPERIMQNISIVTRHLHTTLALRRVADRARRVLTPVPTREGRLLHRDDCGCWRAFVFIEAARGFERATGASMAYEAARAFGEFVRDLADLAPRSLTETLPAFHHTPARYLEFERALRADPDGRGALVGPEIAFARARRALAEIPSRLVREGQIPWRVTHNDTKLDNVLFDETSGAALCVVDLDTVMPGLSLYDFGDLVRSAAHRAAEDTTELDTVGIEIPLFAALVAGYLAGTGGCLTPAERDHLGFAGQIVALETGLRFLTDYLQGDVYFKTDREHHNLERCRVQFRLVESIEARMTELEDVVRRAGCWRFCGRTIGMDTMEPPGQSEVIAMHDGILVGKGEAPQHLLYAMANRHGLIAGATGTGKTASVRVLAEGLAQGGVAVFLADVKGDLSGIGQPASDDPKLAQRAQATGVGEFVPAGCWVVHWDIFGKKGHPIRTTISEMGPFLLARLLTLTPAQEGALNIAFRIADEEGLLLLDLKDLRAMLDHIAARAALLTGRYGNVGKSSVGAIQRQLLALEQEGGEALFGEPAFDIQDLMAADGQGSIHLLAAEDLIHRPRLYATFLLALLSEIFEELPEAGDLDRPKLVFFFDEAHLLFGDAPKALLDKIEQVVRLIRSKGVGVYFISQSPLDIPEAVLGQLGNRIQHALRAFTPRDQKAVRAAAETFRANPDVDVAKAITELAVGEALVSMLDENGVPTAVERALIRPPASRLGPATPREIAEAIANGPLAGKYENAFDRESAYEHLRRRAEAALPPAAGAHTGPTGGRPAPGRETAIEALAKSAARSIGSTLGRQIVRGVLGALLRGR